MGGSESGNSGVGARLRIADRSASVGTEARRARALNAVDRIIDAGRALTQDQGGASFTVQHVAERAGVALQTFYRHFRSKDELVLAIFEEAATEGTAEIARAAEAAPEPVQQLKVIVTRAVLPDVSVPRLNVETMVKEHLRLYQSFPREVEKALLPFRALVADAIRAAQAVGEFPGVEADIEAELVHQLIIAQFHLRALGVVTDHSTAADNLWSFCLGALRRNQVRLT
jgi:AcrR family transcriptional regulator